jgi:hypothetical protein
MRTLWFALAFVVAPVGWVHAAKTWYVDQRNCSGIGTGTREDPFCKIQSGVTAAQDGDAVLVMPGIYVENVDFDKKTPPRSPLRVMDRGKPISLRSAEGPATTVIDGNGAGLVVRMDVGDLESVSLEGFEIRNGEGVYAAAKSIVIRGNVIHDTSSFTGNAAVECYGVTTIDHNLFFDNGDAAIRIDFAATIEHNEIRNNGAGVEGGYADLEIRNNTITHNRGAAIGLGKSTGLIENNVIADNDGGIGFFESGDMTIVANQIVRNHGPGLAGSFASGTIRNNRFAGNTGAAFDTLLSGPWLIDGNEISGNAGGLNLSHCTSVQLVGDTVTGNRSPSIPGLSADKSPVTVTDTIFWDNGTTTSDADVIANDGSTLTFSYSDVEGGQSGIVLNGGSTLTWGPGMIEADPLFVGPDDLRLSPASPCIDVGDPASQPCDADLADAPRLQDGNLDATRLIDMGAREFTNVDLAVRDSASGDLARAVTRPRSLMIETTGTPGLSVLLIVGVQPGLVCGSGQTFLIDFSSPWLVLPWGSIPSRRVFGIPDETNAFDVFLQEVAASGSLLNTSNLVTIEGRKSH